MCHRCLNTGRIVYGPETLSGQVEVPCSCSYRGRSLDPPDSDLVGSVAVRGSSEKKDSVKG